MVKKKELPEKKELRASVLTDYNLRQSYSLKFRRSNHYFDKSKKTISLLIINRNAPRKGRRTGDAISGDVSIAKLQKKSQNVNPSSQKRKNNCLCRWI